MSSSIAGAADARPELIASTIPLLDVAPYLVGEPGARERLGAELRWAFEKVGFYYLRGHGIPQSLIDTTFAQAARFHALPMERKFAVKVNEDNVGYLSQRPPRPRPHQPRAPPKAAGTAPSYSASGTEQKSSRVSVNAPFAGEGARALPPLLELLEATKLVGIDSCARIAGPCPAQ